MEPQARKEGERAPAKRDKKAAAAILTEQDQEINGEPRRC